MSERVEIKISRHLFEELKAEAERLGRPIQELVDQALAEFKQTD